jgi:hypothetical protein
MILALLLSLAGTATASADRCSYQGDGITVCINTDVGVIVTCADGQGCFWYYYR